VKYKLFYFYQAKIACSAICKCIGCKNCVDPIGSPPGPGEKRNSKIAALVSHPNNTPEARTASNTTPQNSKVEERTSDPPKGSATTTSTSSSRYTRSSNFKYQNIKLIILVFFVDPLSASSLKKS
jgi:hypothetical protein